MIGAPAEQRVGSATPEAGVQVERENVFAAAQMLREPRAEELRTRPQLAPAEKKPAVVFVLTFGDRGFHTMKTQSHRNGRGADAEAVVRRRRFRVEQSVQLAVQRRCAFPALPVQKEVAVEI